MDFDRYDVRPGHQPAGRNVSFEEHRFFARTHIDQRSRRSLDRPRRKILATDLLAIQIYHRPVIPSQTQYEMIQQAGVRNDEPLAEPRGDKSIQRVRPEPIGCYLITDAIAQ